MTNIKNSLWGVGLCLLMAIPCYFLGKAFPVVGGPVFAIILGMIITALIKDKTKFQVGIAFTSKKVLQYAVILLGFGLNLSTIAQVGMQSMPIILATVTTSLVISFVLCKVMKVPTKTATLVGVGSSICGGSAIAAAAPVIGADDEEIAQSISVIFLFNIIAALIFPTMGGVLGLTDEGFSLFAGTAVNDTSSVTAAAAAWEEIRGVSGVLEGATTVKLTRTLAIIPICLVLALVRAKKEKTGGGAVNIGKIFPMFILWFVLASVLTTFLPIPKPVLDLLKWTSKFFIIMAMGAIGLNTNLVKLIKTGGKPIFMGFCCWIGITGVSLLMQHVLGMW